MPVLVEVLRFKRQKRLGMQTFDAFHHGSSKAKLGDVAWGKKKKHGMVLRQRKYAGNRSMIVYSEGMKVLFLLHDDF